MFKLKGLSIRVQLFLLGGVTVLGLAIFGLIAFITLNKIMVNGPIYKNIVLSKDLISEINPPPEYIIEAYLTMYQAVDAVEENDPGMLNTLHDRFRQLQKEFDERRAFWRKELPEGPVKELMMKKSSPPAADFFRYAEKNLFPALSAHNTLKATEAVEVLKMDYEMHRQAIDQLVKMAAAQNIRDEKSADEIIKKQEIVLVAIMIFTIALGGFFAFVLSKNLLLQIGGEPTYLAEVARKIADGDLTVKMDGSGTMTGIWASMAVMIEGLTKLVVSIKTNAQTIAASGEQLSANADQMARGVANESGRTTQIATSANEMSQTVNDIARNASDIATEASGTGDLAKNGKKIVDQSVTESETIAAVVSKTAEKIINLNDQSKKIGEIVDVIKDIADQTNLLALNAAIEAARAGEQGRGFAVVADEVRKLAERTSSATSEVANIILAIQNEIRSAGDSMKETTEKVKTGVELSVQAGESLDAMVRNIETLQERVRQIAIATEEMSTTSETISSDIHDIATVAGEAASGSSQIAGLSTDLAKLAADLQQLIVKFKV